MAVDPDAEALINILSARIDVLEASIGTPVDLTELTNRVSALEAKVNVPINPHTVIQQYEDNSEIIYKKAP
jgi:hypothetical protein